MPTIHNDHIESLAQPLAHRSDPPQQMITADQSPAMAMVEAITRAASDPSVDAGKMERLWAIAKEAQAQQAEREYSEAMSAAQAEMPRIVKTALNKQTSSKYAKLEHVIDQITPVYTKHGFSLSFGTADSPLDKHIRITCETRHAGGHKESSWYDQPIDDAGIRGEVNKTPTHGRGSALTYGRRYLTTLIFNLSIGEDDDGNMAGRGAPLDEKDAEWLTKIDLAQTPDQYQAVKKACTIAYGTSQKIPAKLKEALNKARDAVMPRD